MVTLPKREKEKKETKRGRERSNDLAGTRVKMKSKNEPHNEIVELELKGMAEVEVKINHFAKNKIISHRKLSSNSTTDPPCIISLPQGKTLRVTAENLKCK